MDIVAYVAEKLGIDQATAKGAVGLILKFAKEKLGGERFAQLSQYLPAADELASAAPESGGMAGAIGGLASKFLGGDAGNLADMAGGLSKLGMGAGDVKPLAESVLSYFQENGQTEAASLLQEAVK
jgi:hypothetical protein